MVFAWRGWVPKTLVVTMFCVNAACLVLTLVVAVDRFAASILPSQFYLLVECATTFFMQLGRCHSPSEYVVIIATSSAVRASARSRFQYLCRSSG